MELKPEIVIKSQHSSLENFNSHFPFSETNNSNINTKFENGILIISYDACNQSIVLIKSNLQPDLDNKHINLSSFTENSENSEHVSLRKKFLKPGL